jgi:predicted RNase H-like nuclease
VKRGEGDGADAAMVFVAGADGCRAGWFAVLRDLESGATSHHVAPDFAQLLQVCSGVVALALDMPIGLMDCVEKGGRPVDRLARERLKPHRTSSVFSPPCRAALACETYEEALGVTQAHSAAGRGLTLQSFGLFPKLREVDGLMTPELQQLVREAHPELCFAGMNGGRPLEVSKQKPGGQEVRLRLLAAAGFDMAVRSVRRAARGGVGRVDVLDAYACCWTAGRIARGEAERLAGEPGVDARGLWMELWV